MNYETSYKLDKKKQKEIDISFNKEQKKFALIAHVVLESNFDAGVLYEHEVKDTNKKRE